MASPRNEMVVRQPRPPQESPKPGRLVRVYATSENIRKYIYHPAGRYRFSADGVADWPMDQFTQRRLRDGDITLEKPQEKAKEPKRVTQRSEP